MFPLPTRPEWEGERAPRQVCPPRGQHVVYLLTDDLGRVVYVGVTSAAADRLRAHRARTPDWTFWRAIGLPNRHEAERLEADLIQALVPRLNVAGVA